MKPSREHAEAVGCCGDERRRRFVRGCLASRPAGARGARRVHEELGREGRGGVWRTFEMFGTLHVRLRSFCMFPHATPCPSLVPQTGVCQADKDWDDVQRVIDHTVRPRVP